VAKKFAEQGFDVAAFDYCGWGHSEGKEGYHHSKDHLLF